MALRLCCVICSRMLFCSPAPALLPGHERVPMSRTRVDPELHAWLNNHDCLTCSIPDAAADGLPVDSVSVPCTLSAACMSACNHVLSPARPSHSTCLETGCALLESSSSAGLYFVPVHVGSPCMARGAGDVFVKPELRQGILPRILAGLLKARAATRVALKKTSEATQQAVLDSRQKALKVGPSHPVRTCSSMHNEIWEDCQSTSEVQA